MKTLKKVALVLFIIPIIFMFTACSFGRLYVKSITKTGSSNTTDTYTVTFSDGSTDTLTIEHGKNGENGADLTIETIKSYCEENDLDFEEFLAKYLTVSTEDNGVKSATNIAMQSAVSIIVEHPVLPVNQTSPAVFFGSGVIYQMDSDYSYILTNYHVVHYEESLTSNQIANKINVFQYGQQYGISSDNTSSMSTSYTYGDGAVLCEYVGGTDKYDLAIIKAPTATLLEKNPTAQAVTIAEDYSLADSVIAAGNPQGLSLSVTEGIISVESESINLYSDDSSYYVSHRVMRVDAAINGGNSGGGLFNNKGELVGIVNAKLVSSEIENMAYAIPVDKVTQVANSIIYYHKLAGTTANPKQAVFNLYYTEQNLRSVYSEEDNRIYLYSDCVIASDPEKDTLAYNLGFKKDDIIKSVTIKRGDSTFTTEIKKAYQFSELTLSIRSSDTITVVVERSGENVTLGNLSSFAITDANIVECDLTNYKKLAS